MQILIADDDPISRRLAMHALAGCGADVAVAEDGHAAWAQIQERTQSTVLILDRMMPGVDGVVDDKYWQQLEGYLADHSDAEFSHGICPECFPSVLEGIRDAM